MTFEEITICKTEQGVMEEPLEIKIIKFYASETIQPQLLFMLNILKHKQSTLLIAFLGRKVISRNSTLFLNLP